MPNVMSLKGSKKGLSADASMVTDMKRNNAIVSAYRDPKAPPLRDGILTRGYTDGITLPFVKKGYSLSFFNVK